MGRLVVEVLAEIGSEVNPLLEKYIMLNASEEFRAPLLHTVSAGGKRVRPALALLSAEAAGGRREDALPWAAAVELAHNYSLILDDIIDRGEVRRGRPTVWKKYGLGTAILVAAHYREAVSDAISDSPSSERLHRLMARTLKILVEGERLDILFERAGRSEPYFEENRRASVGLGDYLGMVYSKTGALIEAACGGGGIAAGAPEEAVKSLFEYGKNVGIAFQIADDIIDIFGDPGRMGKKLGKDIEEHKLGNIVVLKALEELGEDGGRELIGILRKPVVGDEDIMRAVRLISSTGAREAAYRLGEEYVRRAKEALARLPASRARSLLEELADFILRRTY